MKPKKGKIVESKAEILHPEQSQGEISPSVDVETSTDGDDVATAEAVEQEGINANRPSQNVVKSKNRWWIRYVITAAVLSVLAVLIAWGQGTFEITNTKFLLGELSTAFFVPGIFTVGFGLLILCSNGGAFDIFAYGFMSVVRMFKKDPLDRKYGGYAQYRKTQREKKRSFWYLVIVGGVFLIVGGALLIAYSVM